MCAFGRCEVNPKDVSWAVEYRFDSDPEEMDLALKEEYRGHGITFWLGVQNLHDSPLFWKSKGLSKVGAAHVSGLKKHYA